MDDVIREKAIWVVNAFDQANTEGAIERLGSRGIILKKAVEELRKEVNRGKQRTVLSSRQANTE